jgi:hypothetical protein
MRLALVVALLVLAVAGWRHRVELPVPLFHHHHRISYGQVSTADAAARWLETSSGQDAHRARCTASGARPPAPPIPSFVAAGQVTIGAYSCRAAAAGRRAHAWCVVAFRYRSPSVPPVIVWDAAYSTCGTLARVDVQRAG